MFAYTVSTGVPRMSLVVFNARLRAYMVSMRIPMLTFTVATAEHALVGGNDVATRCGSLHENSLTHIHVHIYIYI